MSTRALVIGIPHTSFAELPDLPAVISDVTSLERTLSERGFEVRPLHTPAPDCDSVKRALQSLVADTRAGDLGIIYFSGHGYRLLDGSGDEADCWDEAIVCSDGPLIDDWFRDTLWKTAHLGSRFVVIIDACHSDTAILGFRVNQSDRPPPQLETRPGKGLWRIVLAACRDEETTLEFGQGDEGGGVVTRELLAVLKEQPDISHRDLWVTVAANVRDRYFERRVGVPHLTSSGDDDSLLVAAALTAGLDD